MKKALLFVLAIILLVIFVFVYIAKDSTPLNRPCMVQCKMTMDGIGQSILLYQEEHKGKNPLDLNLLMQYEDVPLRMLTCPCTEDYEDRYKDSRFWYVYRGNDLDETCSDGLILLYDRLGNHEIYRNVVVLKKGKKNQLGVFVHTLTEKEFQKEIQKDNNLRKELGFSIKEIE